MMAFVSDPEHRSTGAEPLPCDAPPGPVPLDETPGHECGVFGVYAPNQPLVHARRNAANAESGSKNP